jgi:protein O-mannosyl-transferase
MREFFIKRRSWFLGLALVGMTLFAYVPAMRDGGFIWDDESYVIYNNTLRDVSGFKDIWTDPQATPQYYPLVHTTFWIEYQLWELNPTGYHVNNVLLHAVAALLLWFVLQHLKVPGAWLVGCLFALHPVHVESVGWITERKNVLSGVFYLWSALVYLKWVDAKTEGGSRPIVYWAAFMLFIAALLSKTVTTSLPAALLLVAWWKEGEKPERIPTAEEPGNRQRFGPILPLVPFFVLGFVLSGVTVWLEKHHVGAKGAEWDLSFIDRCLIAGRALWFYISKLLLPSRLCFSYPRWEIDAGLWWQYLYPLTFAVLIGLLWVSRKRLGRGPLVAVLYFAGTLFPALGFFDVYPMRYSFVADHFNYLSSIGILVLVGAGMASFGQWLTPARVGMHGRLARGLPVAGLLLLLGILSWKQCGIYQGLETLWLDTIAKNPTSWMAFNNLGQLYIKENRVTSAIPLLERAIDLNPREGSALRNLGVAFSRLGRKEDAVQQYRKALVVDANDAHAYSNLGAVQAKLGRFDEAIVYYQKALAIEPDLAPAHSNLAAALASLGRIDEAIQHHELALGTEPKLGAAHFQYGETLQLAGRIRDAEERYRMAVSLDPSLARAHNHLGMIAAAGQLLPAALAHFRNAVAAAPDFAEAHNNLAKVLVSIGRFEEAEKHFIKALQLAPQSAPIRLDYADFLAQRGDEAAARQEFAAAVALMPDNPDPVFEAGMIDQQRGEAAAAEARFRALLQRWPEHAEAHNHLAFLLAGRGQNEEAITLLLQAVKLAPEHAEFHNNLGVILVRMGRHQDALKVLGEAVRLKPDYSEAVKNLDDLRNLLNTRSQP